MSESLQYTVRLRSGEEFGPADTSLLTQWAREGRLPRGALLVPVGGGESFRVDSHPPMARLVNAPPTLPTSANVPIDSPDESVATLIPYRNPQALVGYYMSIVSLLPLLGAVAGPIAIRLGVVGLRKRRTNPHLHGTAHAWIAIILGVVGTLVSVTCIGAIAFAFFFG